MLYSQMFKSIIMTPRTIVYTLCYILSLGERIEAHLVPAVDVAYIFFWLYWLAIYYGVMGYFRPCKKKWMNNRKESEIRERLTEHKCAEAGLFWAFAGTLLCVVATMLLIIHLTLRLLPSKLIVVDASFLLIAHISILIIMSFKFKQQFLRIRGKFLEDLVGILMISPQSIVNYYSGTLPSMILSTKLVCFTADILISVLNPLQVIIFYLRILITPALLLELSTRVIVWKWNVDGDTWAIPLLVILALGCTYNLVIQVLTNVGIISSRGGRHKRNWSFFSDFVRLPSYVRNMCICLVCLTVLFQMVGLPLGNHFALVEGILVAVCWGRVIMVEARLCESKCSVLLLLHVSFFAVLKSHIFFPQFPKIISFTIRQKTLIPPIILETHTRRRTTTRRTRRRRSVRGSIGRVLILRGGTRIQLVRGRGGGIQAPTLMRRTNPHSFVYCALLLSSFVSYGSIQN